MLLASSQREKREQDALFLVLEREREREREQRRDGDVQDGGGEGGGRGRIRGSRGGGRGAASAGGGGGRGGAGAARGDAAARGASGAVRGRHDRHAPRPAEQRVRHRRLLRPRGLQVPRLCQRPLRRLLAAVRVLHGRAEARHRTALLGRLPPGSGVHVPDPRGSCGGGGAAVSRLQRRQGGDVERGVRRFRQLLQSGAHLRRHHLRHRALFHHPLPRLLVPPLQRLRSTAIIGARQQGRGDRRLPTLNPPVISEALNFWREAWLQTSIMCRLSSNKGLLYYIYIHTRPGSICCYI